MPRHDARVARLGVEVERRILVVQLVVVAAGEQGPHEELRRRLLAGDVPAHDGARRSTRDEDLLRDVRAIRQPPAPRRPRVGVKLIEPPEAIRVQHVGKIALRRQVDAALGRVDPRVESVDEHHPPGRRRGRDDEQPVIAARAHAAHRAGREPAQAVGLEPLSGIQVHEGNVRISDRINLELGSQNLELLSDHMPPALRSSKFWLHSSGVDPICPPNALLELSIPRGGLAVARLRDVAPGGSPSAGCPAGSRHRSPAVG